jgi:hypothetical protein
MFHFIRYARRAAEYSSEQCFCTDRATALCSGDLGSVPIITFLRLQIYKLGFILLTDEMNTA